MQRDVKVRIQEEEEERGGGGSERVGGNTEEKRGRRDSLIKRITQSQNVRRETGNSSCKSSSGSLVHSPPQLNNKKQSRFQFDTHIHVHSVRRTWLSRTEARENGRDGEKTIKMKKCVPQNHSRCPRGERKPRCGLLLHLSIMGWVNVNTSDCTDLHQKQPKQTDLHKRTFIVLSPLLPAQPGPHQSISSRLHPSHTPYYILTNIEKIT